MSDIQPNDQVEGPPALGERFGEGDEELSQGRVEDEDTSGQQSDPRSERSEEGADVGIEEQGQTSEDAGEFDDNQES